MDWQFFEEDEKVDQEILSSDVMTDEIFTPDPELLKRLDRIRRRMFRVEVISLIMLAGAFVAGTIIKLIRMDDDVSYFIFFGLMLGAFIIGLFITGIYRGKRQFRKTVKEELIFPALRNHFDHLIYYWDGLWTKDDIIRMGFLKGIEDGRSEDYISAEYHGVHFEQADVTTSGKKDAGGKEHGYFRGRILVFENSKWRGDYKVKVYSKGFEDRDILPDFQKVEMENVKFNQLFDVYSDSSHHAFYVLAPQIMERMAEFGRRYPRLVFHVTDGKMYVGVDQIARDAFEVDLHKPLDYNRIRGNISIDVQVIKDLIDVMKIDNQKMDSINYE